MALASSTLVSAPRPIPVHDNPDLEQVLRQGGVRLCHACFGDLIRVDGVIRCSNCGWPASDPLPVRNPAVPPEERQRRESRLLELERENAKLLDQVLRLQVQAEQKTIVLPVPVSQVLVPNEEVERILATMNDPDDDDNDDDKDLDVGGKVDAPVTQIKRHPRRK